MTILVSTSVLANHKMADLRLADIFVWRELPPQQADNRFPDFKLFYFN